MANENRKQPSSSDILDDARITALVEKTSAPTDSELGAILKKAAEKKGLSLEDAAKLLAITSASQREKLFAAAKKVKQDIYGKRLVLFAPLYASSFCVNDCSYCGFRCSNKITERKKLTMDEVSEQARILEEMGHKRLLLEFGEDEKTNPIDYVIDVINAIYKTKTNGGKGEIRRVNVNIAATTTENYKKLKAAGIGTYQLFQETYHKPTYAKLHCGPKADYERQITAHNRAFAAGIDDLGIGVLFGLYDYRFEALALLSHAQYMDKTLGVGPHTISVPRFCPAPGVEFTLPYRVADEDFLKLIAILRLSVPYTGMIISTRETPEIRKKAFEIGISQASAASETAPGGYSREKKSAPLLQFKTNDHRSVEEIVQSICEQGYLTSFCTACYRSKRTGERFMKLAKSGEIHNLCNPNAILTFKEYLLDYAGENTKKLGERTIKRMKRVITDASVRSELEKRLLRLESGERDLYF